MRIIQFSDTFLPIVDGVGQVVYGYAQTLGAMGHDVTVCAPRTNMGDLSDAPFTVVPYTAMPMPGKMPYYFGFPQIDVGFDTRLQRQPSDIVHVHSPFMSGHAGIQLARHRGIPVVGSFHSKLYDDLLQVLKSEFLAREGTRKIVEFYERCDEVWAVSESTAETLREYGYTGRLRAMPNGTHIRPLDPSVLPELRARLHLSADETVLLYVGQMNWKKNIRHILEAAKLLMDGGTAFRLVMAGQGPHAEEIRSTCAQLGIDGRVLFPGHIRSTRELDGLYAMASLFVFPSLYDNAPMVLREAAAMGTPAVLVAGSTAAEGIRDGVNGFTCEDTPAALAEAIRRGLRDTHALAAIGARARETIPIAWESLMRDVLARYASLIDERRTTRT